MERFGPPVDVLEPRGARGLGACGYRCAAAASLEFEALFSRWIQLHPRGPCQGLALRLIPDYA